MTEDEMKKLIVLHERYSFVWTCPKCGLLSDEHDFSGDALEDLRYHINEDHKGED